MTVRILEARGVSVGYGQTTVLKNLSLVINEGETVALLGRSGSGKSTLLKALCLFEPLREGEILYRGQIVADSSGARVLEQEYRREVSMVFQQPSLLPHLTVLENIAIGVTLSRGLGKEESFRRAENIVQSLYLSGVGKSFPEELSGGQYQRVQLARLAVLKPPMMLLDEITSSVDPSTTQEIIETLKRLQVLQDQEKQASLVATHHLEFAVDFADRILFLGDGSIIEDSPSEAVRCGRIGSHMHDAGFVRKSES